MDHTTGTRHLAEYAVIVQDRVERYLQDVGVDVRSDKHGAGKMRMETIVTTHVHENITCACYEVR